MWFLCSLVIYVPWASSTGTIFSRFLPTGTINFSARQDAATIRGREQNEGGVNITRQCMPSRVLARVRSVRHEDLIAASNERSCLSQDLCCGISCHPSRLYSALDRPPCRGVSTFAPGGWLELHPPRVDFIIVWALFEGGVNFA